MRFVQPSDPEPAIKVSPAVPDVSRRAFLARLVALATTAGLGLVPQSDAADGWWDEPPMMSPPQWSRRAPQSWNRPPAHSWNQPPPQPWVQPWTTTDLNATIEHYVAHLHQTGRLAVNERTAWLVYDFTSRRFLVTINAGIPYQSASMIKPFIALAFFQKVQEGQLNYTPFHRQRMEAMIQHSDNHATNYFIALLNRTSGRFGPAEAEHTLKRRHPGMFRQTRIVEYIPSGGRTYRNRASALDYHRFLQALWYDQLPYSAELRRLMYLPNRDRIYTGATGVARGTAVIDKTGTTARLCGDMGILVARGRDGRNYPYTFIGIIEKAQPTQSYTAWQAARGNIIRDVSSMVYGHLRQMYDLV
ncbi:MAG: serine hydrolase [Candidatus Competibacteraceae bacterium]